VLAAVALALIAYHQIAFAGKTFDTSYSVAGVNGLAPDTGMGGTYPSVAYGIDRGASAWQTRPWAQVVANALDHGHLPLWNPYEGAGEPMAADAQSAVFDPLMLPMNLFPSAVMWDLCFLLAYALASVSTYLFLRNLALSPIAALTGCAAFVMCGFFALLGNNTYARLYLYLPLILLLIDLCVRSRHLRWVAALGAAIAASILGGMPEVSFMVLAVAVCYGVYRGRRSAVRLLGAGALGICLAAPLEAPFAAYLPISLNSHAAGLGAGRDPFASLLNWFLPLVNGYPNGPFVVKGQGMAASWVGVAVPVLCLIAVATPGEMRKRGGWLFLGIAVVVLCKLHGVGGFGWIGDLPVANRVVWTQFAAPVVSFCLAVVASIGVEAICRGSLQPRRLAACLGVGVAIFAGLLVADRTVLGHRVKVGGHPMVIAGVAAAAILLAAAVSLLWRSRPLPDWVPVAAGCVAALVVLGEAYAFFPQGVYAQRADPYRSPPWLGMIDGGRVFGLDQVLYPDTAGALGLYDIRTLNALYVKRYADFINAFVSPTFTDRFTGEGVAASVLQSPYFDLLGVRYILSSTVVVGFPLIGQADDVRVYENPAALPRAFVVGQVSEVNDEAEALKALHRIEPSQDAVVEGTAPRVDPRANSRAANIVSQDDDTVTIHVDAGAQGVLVLSDVYAPGWSATVNGAASRVLPTDVAFRGVAVGSGAVTVVFHYRPPGWQLAVLLPIIGLLGLAGAGLLRRVRPTALVASASDH
jgi:hypothetical protein